MITSSPVQKKPLFNRIFCPRLLIYSRTEVNSLVIGTFCVDWNLLITFDVEQKSLRLGGISIYVKVKVIHVQPVDRLRGYRDSETMTEKQNFFGHNLDYEELIGKTRLV